MRRGLLFGAAAGVAAAVTMRAMLWASEHRWTIQERAWAVAGPPLRRLVLAVVELHEEAHNDAGLAEQLREKARA